MKIGSWNWTEARTQCNKLDPKSHAAVLNTIMDKLLFTSYFQAEGKNEILNFHFLQKK